MIRRFFGIIVPRGTTNCLVLHASFGWRERERQRRNEERKRVKERESKRRGPATSRIPGFHGSIVSRPIRTCSITVHCAPVMFHTLKTTIGVDPAGLLEERGRRGSSSPLLASRLARVRKIADLFIYLGTEAQDRPGTPESHVWFVQVSCLLCQP